MIDSTLLRPDAKQSQVETLCEEAVRFGFATVCVNPFWVPSASKELAGSIVHVGTVIGFPFGADSLETKEFETQSAIRDGANEIDFVMNISAFKSRMWHAVSREMRTIVRIAKPMGVLTKVILEVGYLDDFEKVRACLMARGAGVDFVKTSTGYGPKGAEPGDVRLMKNAIGSGVGVKAAGGIMTLSQAIQLIEAGASRLGTSHAKALMEEYGEFRLGLRTLPGITV
jgi:deoxyribose-phosphate aldolase